MYKGLKRGGVEAIVNEQRIKERSYLFKQEEQW